jgi:hypothetical protein
MNLSKMKSNSEEKNNNNNKIKNYIINNKKSLTNVNTKIINKLNQTNSNEYIYSMSTTKNQNILSLKNSSNSFLTKSENYSLILIIFYLIILTKKLNLFKIIL